MTPASKQGAAGLAPSKASQKNRPRLISSFGPPILYRYKVNKFNSIFLLIFILINFCSGSAVQEEFTSHSIKKDYSTVVAVLIVIEASNCGYSLCSSSILALHHTTGPQLNNLNKYIYINLRGNRPT